MNLNYSKFKRCELREELIPLNKAIMDCQKQLDILRDIYKAKAAVYTQLDREIANVEKLQVVEAENEKKGNKRTKSVDPVAAAVKELPKDALLNLIASVRASQS